MHPHPGSDTLISQSTTTRGRNVPGFVVIRSMAIQSHRSTPSAEPAESTGGDAPAGRGVVETHYRRLAGAYDDLLSYSGDFVRCVSAKITEKLRLAPDDAFVDLGGGTGMYSAAVLERVPLRRPVLLVDPLAEMLAKVPPGLPIEPLQMDALAFSAQPGRYDKILMKESVHHVEERTTLFRNLYQRLNPEGILLLVHIPPILDYPLFAAALARSRHWHADPDELEGLLRGAGFAVERDALDYRHVIAKRDYFRMVGNRYMSLLSSFSDAELAAGLREMEERYAGRDMLEFNDHFDYLTATKPPARPHAGSGPPGV